MTEGPRILLTNDDGIDAQGLRSLYDALQDLGDVTVVAPSTDHSGMGRVLSMGRTDARAMGDDIDPVSLDPPGFSWEVPYTDHDLGYEVNGTPADCVVAGVHALDTEIDVVVSGCNPGPNWGTSAFGRSGTVSAAMEAAHLGVPGIAVSSASIERGRESFAVEASVTRDLVAYSLRTDVFEDVEYLNTVVPATAPEGVAVTQPIESTGLTAQQTDGERRFRFSFDGFDRLDGDGSQAGPPGTDSHAIARDMVSISPLRLPHGHVESPVLETFAADYEFARRTPSN